MRILGVFEKSERIRHIGHLDIQRAVQRGLRRSGLPVAYSNGFNPHILVSFASALSTGASGKKEIMDVKMAEEIPAEEFLEKMNAAMPPEMQLSLVRPLEDRHPALSTLLRAGTYEMRIPDPEAARRLISALEPMMRQEQILVNRKSKSGIREVDMKPLIYALSGREQTLWATLTLTEKESCKPAMILEGLQKAAGIPEQEIRMLVCRTGLLGEAADGSLVPLESL